MRVPLVAQFVLVALVALCGPSGAARQRASHSVQQLVLSRAGDRGELAWGWKKKKPPPRCFAKDPGGQQEQPGGQLPQGAGQQRSGSTSGLAVLQLLSRLAASFVAAHAELGPRVESLVASATYGHLGALSEYIFKANHTLLYDVVLARGCSEYANTSCPVQFYKPSRVAGGLAGVVAKCTAVSGRNKCDRCECIANNVLFNGDIPEAGVDMAVAAAFAEALVLARDLTVADWRAGMVLLLRFLPQLAASFVAAHAELGPRVDSLVANATYNHLGALSDYVFKGNHTGLYDTALARGCCEYAGRTCPVKFYDPSRVFGGLVGVVAKCVAVSGLDKCNRCECIANNLLFNGDIPQAGVDAAVSTALARALELTENLVTGATKAPAPIPTLKPTKPSKAPTTHKPSKEPTTHKPSKEPTTHKPSKEPTTKAPRA
jgi:hypothetical protein